MSSSSLAPGPNTDRQYSAVSQQAEDGDSPPQYQDLLTSPHHRASFIEEREESSSRRPRTMPDLEAVCGPSRGHVKCKLATGVSVVLVAVLIACIADSYHKIHEGNVGIYYKHGALQDRVTDPGVHFMMPFIEDFTEVRIRPETFELEAIRAITKDGIENTFREITVITTTRKENIVAMTKKFGADFKRALVSDRIKEELRIFCANHTIDEVYNEMFLEIVGTVLTNVRTSISRLAEDGIEILNLVVPKPEIPEDIAHNYKQVKVQWTEQLVATQQQKTEAIKKETERQNAVADAERKKDVIEIQIQEHILQEEGKRNVSTINNEIKKAAEENDADIHKYKVQQEAAANAELYTQQYVQLNLAKSISNNTKFYFSGAQSELGSIFSKILT